MTLRVVGAGVGRTGTASLKAALETLLGGPCYHMFEVSRNPEHIPLWHGAALGRMPDWEALFAGYQAAVDWPSASFWPELVEAFPDALVVLSLRSAESWWRSASETILRPREVEEGLRRDQRAMFLAIAEARFTPDTTDRDAAIRAFEEHNARVKASVPRERLLVWEARDGWDPLCAALGLAVPDAPFPHTNTAEEFRERMAQRSGARITGT